MINSLLRMAAIINIVLAIFLAYGNKLLWAALVFVLGVIMFGFTVVRERRVAEDLESPTE